MAYDGAGSVYAIGTRFSRLDADGVPLVGAGNAYVSRAIVTAGVGIEYEDGEEIIQRNGAGQICVSFRAPDTVKRGTITALQFCSPDPYVSQFLIGGAIIERAAVAEVQTVTITGTPTGGSFTLTFDGQTTGAIDFDAANTDVDTALEALSNIGTGEVTVTGGPGPGAAFTVTFASSLGNVPLMTATSSLTGGASPTVTVTAPTQGTNLTAIGYRAPEVGGDPMPNGVSVEMWSRAVQDGAQAAELPYIHWVIPRAYLRLSDNLNLGAENAMTPTFEGWSNQNINWGDGPEGDWAYGSDRIWQYSRVASTPDFDRGLIAVA